MLTELERAVQGQRFDEALSLLHTLLSNFDRVQQSGGSDDVSRSALRLANATAELLLNPRFVLPQDAYATLCMSQPALAGVFLCTDWGSPDHVIAGLADLRDPANLRFGGADVLRKCLLCYTPESRYRLELGPVAEQYPEIVAPAIVGRLGCDLLARPRIAATMDDLLAHDWSFLRGYTPPLPLVLGLSHAWMNCSYATHPDKHRVKADLNGMARHWLAAQGIELDRTRARRDAERPRVLVPLELFHSTHAMFRCFGRVVASLAERFELIGLAPEHCVDDEAKEIFPRFVSFDARRLIEDFPGLVAELRALEPDIVYYPSLGMANYTILLANLRIAPLQCFTLGHPATSMCDTIDCALVQEQDFASADAFSETVVLTGNETSPTIDRVLENIAEPVIRERPETIEIAVNSKHMKLHHRFLETCRRIAARAGRPVRFHFFPGVSGYRHAFVRHEIRRILPGSEVYPTTDYETYIGRINACDVRLGTFPFGGANTNMDCFGLGIPFVVLDGSEPHARSDAAQLGRSGLPEWLVAASEDAYIEAACRLVEDDDTRVSIARDMLRLRDDGFFHAGVNDEALTFAGTLAWIQRNHPSMRDDERRVWTRADQQRDLVACASP